MEKKEVVKPSILRGFRDFLPGQMQARQKMLLTIKRVFESFGFVPLETPTLEMSEVLLGKYGEEAQQLIYRFKDRGDRDVCMRYDLTVPLSRVVAMYTGELPRIFKRYQIQPVWRADKPQAGRYREFYQCDVDVVGSSSMLADAECVLVDVSVLEALGLQNFVVRINNRKLLDGFSIWAGVEENQRKRVLQALDKFLKIGAGGISEELGKEKETNTFDRGSERYITLPALSEGAIDKIIEFASLTGDNRELVASLRKLFGNIPIGNEGLDELQQVISFVAGYGVPSEKVQLDLSIARGLDYYTGTVFETFLTDLPDFGSVMSGGRFDKLIGMFLGRDIPAVGISLGLDRLYAAMQQLGMVTEVYATAQVLVTVFDQILLPTYLDYAQQLRTAGINAEVYLRPGDELRRQLAYANQVGIPVVVIAGQNEVATGSVKVKNMANRTEEAVPTKELVETVKKQIP